MEKINKIIWIGTGVILAIMVGVLFVDLNRVCEAHIEITGVCQDYELEHLEHPGGHERFGFYDIHWFHVWVNVTNFGMSDVHDVFLIFNFRHNDKTICWTQSTTPKIDTLYTSSSKITTLETLKANTTRSVHQSHGMQTRENMTELITLYHNFKMINQTTVVFSGCVPEHVYADDDKTIDIRIPRISYRWEGFLFYHWIDVKNVGTSDAHDIDVVLHFKYDDEIIVSQVHTIGTLRAGGKPAIRLRLCASSDIDPRVSAILGEGKFNGDVVGLITIYYKCKMVDQIAIEWKWEDMAETGEGTIYVP